MAAKYLKKAHRDTPPLVPTKKDYDGIGQLLKTVQSSYGTANFEGYKLHMIMSLLRNRINFAKYYRNQARQSARAIGGKRPAHKNGGKKK